MYEIERIIKEFLEEFPEGKVTLLYPNELEYVREGIRGMELTKHTFKGEKISFYEHGLYIRDVLGFSLVTGKHLFLPYGSFSILFEEG